MLGEQPCDSNPLGGGLDPPHRSVGNLGVLG
jgi:hypothetical protein